MTKRRTQPHIVSSQSTNKIKTFLEKNDWLLRDITGVDYGIDAFLEYFDAGAITGKFSLIQLKGTASPIRKLKNSNNVSVAISDGTIEYSKQTNIPLILLYTSTDNDSSPIYFMELNSYDFTSTKTVRIPTDNNLSDSPKGLYDIIKKYYNNPPTPIT